MHYEIHNMDASATSERAPFQSPEPTTYGTTSPPTASTNHSPWYKHISVEPIILLFTFSTSLTSPVLTTLFLTHTCRSLGFNQSHCSQLEGSSYSQHLETLVQPNANLMTLYANLIEAGLPAFLSLFLGPWSDLYGRKTFLVAAVCGYALKFLLCLYFSFYPTLPPAYILMASVPVALTGGTISILSMSYCYISDVSDISRRGLRMAMIEASYYAGMLLGSATSAAVFNVGKYATIFSMAAILCFMAVVQGGCWINESVTNKPDNMWRSIFQLRFPREMLAVCSDKRVRAVILLASVAMALSAMTTIGEGSVAFLFTRKKFSWDIGLYTIYSCTYLGLQAIGTVVAVTVLSAWFSEGWLTCMSIALTAIASVMLGVSPAWWWMYLASVVGMFSGVAAPLVRAIITKIVDPGDIGKVLMLMSCVEAITPLVSVPLYALVYNASITTFPGAFYLVSSGLFFTDGIMVCAILLLVRHPTLQPRGDPGARASLLGGED